MAGRVNRRSSRPTPIGKALAEFLGRSGLSGLVSASELVSRWAEIVGPGIAGHCMPREIKGGRLTVIVDSSAWMNQLSLLSSDIISKINKALGGATVTELKLRTGKLNPAGKSTAARISGTKEKPARRRPSAGELEDIERAAANIADPELRARAKKLLLAAASTKR